MLIELEYPLDKDTLLREANSMRGYKPFVAKEGIISAWLIKNSDVGYAKEVADAFGKLVGSNDYQARYYRQAPGYFLNFHKDYGTQCSLNVLLSENADPITFEQGDVYYRTALLNTQSLHAVKNTTCTRVLFKVSILDRTFDEVAKSLESYAVKKHFASLQD